MGRHPTAGQAVDLAPGRIRVSRGGRNHQPRASHARRVGAGDLMPPEDEHRVRVHLDRLLVERGITLTELADRVGLTLANLSVLKNGHARAIRFSTLTALCEA